jgi:hypothetical protein
VFMELDPDDLVDLPQHTSAGPSGAANAAFAAAASNGTGAVGYR